LAPSFAPCAAHDNHLPFLLLWKAELGCKPGCAAPCGADPSKPPTPTGMVGPGPQKVAATEGPGRPRAASCELLHQSPPRHRLPRSVERRHHDDTASATSGKGSSSSEPIFLLCDAGAKGFPIRYASDGFCTLFGYSQASCLGQYCGLLFGGPAVQADKLACHHLALLSDLSDEEVARGLQRIGQAADADIQAMLTQPQEKVGFSLLLCRSRRGTVIVCEVVMLMLQHPEHGWSYTISFLRDVSHVVRARTVLRAAAQGGYGTLLAAWRGGLASRLAKLGIGRGGGGLAEYMHDTALGLKQAAPDERDFQQAPVCASTRPILACRGSDGSCHSVVSKSCDRELGTVARGRRRRKGRPCNRLGVE